MSCPSDRVIQATNDEATYSKAHAVKRGYWKDPYLHIFCPMSTAKSPEISRGYFIRTQSFKAITICFIKALKGECQVVNLGAGSDTLYFQLRDSNMLPRMFVEVDLPHNIHRKVQLIRNKKLVDGLVENIAHELPPQGDSQLKLHPHLASDVATGTNKTDCDLITDTYAVVAFDLRRPVDQLISFLCGEASDIKLNTELPTLFLAECVLVYMPPEGSLQLLQGLAARFPHAAFLHYEQVNMADQFGQIMVKNFRARDCDLPGLSACQSLKQQEMRFLDTGWKKAKAWTINEVYRAFSPSTRLRVERVEMLDDVEIAQQLFEHYCILLASTDEALCPWVPHLDEPLSLIP